MKLRTRLRRLSLALLLLALLWPAAGALAAALGAASDRYYVYQLENISTANVLPILQTLNFEVLPLGTPGVDEALRRPLVIELPDSDPAVSSLVKGNPSLGGNPLAGPTSGQPHQRLLIVWDAGDPAALERLLELLDEQIDVRAKQILIEAVVLEIDRDRIRDLGVSFAGSKDGQAFAFEGAGEFTTPFTYVFERPSVKTLLDLDVKIDALVTRGDASILSQPSIMVLDGRQARIKVGDNIPYTEVAASTFDLESQIVTATRYIQTGITLNLRPRAAHDDSEVTMQVETLISTPAGSSIVVPQTGTLLGPEIRTREVQTLVRVADDTPFIIGGLIAEDERYNRSGIPWLSEIPGIGALFRRTNKARQQKEVIIVITPHVLPLAESSFHHSVIGKDFDNLDRFDLKLFRNLYRIKSEDLFDLDYIYDSELFHAMQRAAAIVGREFSRRAVAAGWAPVLPGDRAALADQMRRALVEHPEFLSEMERDHPGLEIGEPLIHLVSGGIPGEQILVARMLLAIIEKLDFGRHVDPASIVFFNAEAQGDLEALELLEIDPLLPRLEGLGRGCGAETLRMTFDVGAIEGAHHGGLVFDSPGAKLERLRLADDAAFLAELRRLNQPRERGGWQRLGILLNDCYRRKEHSTFDHLKSVLVLKRVLDINPSLPLTLDTFHPGREVVFPSEENLEGRTHVVDRKVAALFYETLDYFYAFEERYKLALEVIDALSEAEAARAMPHAAETTSDPAQ